MESDSNDRLLSQRYKLERLISRISSKIVMSSDTNLDENIECCLRWLAEFTQSDRSYLFQIREEVFADNTHEWCMPGITAQKSELQGLELREDLHFVRQMRAQQEVNYSDVPALPDAYQIEKEILMSQGILSLLTVPMVSNRSFVGFIGIDAVVTKRTWSQDEVYLLKLCGEMFTHALEHKRSAEIIKSSEARLRCIFEKIPTIAVQGYDHQRRVFLWNKASELLYGYSHDEAVGRRLEELIIPVEAREAVIEEITRWLDQDQEIPSGELTLLHKDGSPLRVFSSHVMHTTVTGERELYCVDVDLMPLKNAQLELERLAHFDPLTGLPNRILLSDRLAQMMTSSRRTHQILAVAYLDLDGFTLINDQYGHSVGDRMLQYLAEKMKEMLREDDTLARIGGDEFVAVLGGMSEIQDCEPVLRRLLAAASETVRVNEHQLSVSASIGVTFYPLDDVAPDQLLRHADQAMYLAKQAGKDRYQLFDIQLEAAIRQKQETLKAISKGLKSGQFVLYYQPKINMQTLAFEGAEALIRWQHPQDGLLTPYAFLPVTQGHQLELEIGEWVLNTALQQMQVWSLNGFDCPLSINIAAQQIQFPGFVDQLKLALKKYPHVPPQHVQLEILETSALEDIASVTPILSQCRDLGVSLALDDFGTGYSSLTYLKRLPIDCLKIDQGFVRDIIGDADDLSIIQGVLGLAKAFNLHVIAEGVETSAHCRQLLALGCLSGQGYGIARPMPACELPGWVCNVLPTLCF
ncbi:MULTISPECIES: bifunctional diguanylate cyclase/phosphodiesterase [Nitrincola]|uniref:Bacteriophytochrome cph2 n=1 Tax=Nitrincola nitratireducens TaxID=1229521 RepID=W9UV58_9GAMM|nr:MULTISPECIES: EAL domain-containing protein [Nitrincola]EXJ11128.1 Bacteriophytochrome cph2 [Nitrincola nitratireducens]